MALRPTNVRGDNRRDELHRTILFAIIEKAIAGRYYRQAAEALRRELLHSCQADELLLALADVHAARLLAPSPEERRLAESVILRLRALRGDHAATLQLRDRQAIDRLCERVEGGSL